MIVSRSRLRLPALLVGVLLLLASGMDAFGMTPCLRHAVSEGVGEAVLDGILAEAPAEDPHANHSHSEHLLTAGETAAPAADSEGSSTHSGHQGESACDCRLACMVAGSPTAPALGSLGLVALSEGPVGGEALLPTDQAPVLNALRYLLPLPNPPPAVS